MPLSSQFEDMTAGDLAGIEFFGDGASASGAGDANGLSGWSNGEGLR